MSITTLFIYLVKELSTYLNRTITIIVGRRTVYPTNPKRQKLAPQSPFHPLPKGAGRGTQEILVQIHKKLNHPVSEAIP